MMLMPPLLSPLATLLVPRMSLFPLRLILFQLLISTKMATIQPGNPINEQHAKRVASQSRFNLSYHQFNTHRFGDITPHFALEVVPRDKDVQLRSAHDLRTYTLGAPLMQSLDMKKDYFQVPMEAILPQHWEKIYVAPKIGNDVIARNVNCVVSPASVTGEVTFGSSIINQAGMAVNEMLNLATLVPGNTQINQRVQLEWILRAILYGEMFFSPGNLLSSLGAHFSSCFKYKIVDALGNTVYNDFDALVDVLVEDIKNHYDTFVVRFTEPGAMNTRSIEVSVDGSINNFGNETYSLREALEYLRDNPYFDSISYCSAKSGFDAGTYALDIAGYVSNITLSPCSGLELNLSRPLAYQLVCAHFYSNDNVDYIYSSELFRENWRSIFQFYCMSSGKYLSLSINPYEKTFVYNGLTERFDVFSGYNLTHALGLTAVNWSDFVDPNGNSLSASSVDLALPMGMALTGQILNYKHSLRYMDYFTGSKSRPLAVGSLDVAVNNNAVNVVDVTRNIMMQRFLNAVNQTGRQLSEYVKGMFGVEQKVDYHHPLFLAHTNDTVISNSVENTGTDQYNKPLSVTSSLFSNASKYAFSTSFDRASVVIGVTYYDIARSYFTSVDRHYAHVDRFDMFNPDLQFIGDQQVMRVELNPDWPQNFDDPFAYQNRHMEYKQRVSEACGGFVRNLPGYAFLADYDSARRWANQRKFGPDFIRSHNYEFDRFYLSLTGYSLSSYFHFIVDTFNDCQASRPMIYQSQIL